MDAGELYHRIGNNTASDTEIVIVTPDGKEFNVVGTDWDEATDTFRILVVK